MTNKPWAVLLEDEQELLTLPAVVSELLPLVDAPDARIGEIVALTSSDAALIARVMRLLNSPYYALPAKVDSVYSAVSMVGRQNLGDLMIATKVAEKFSDFPGKLIDVRRFWHHNLYAASVARDIHHAHGESGHDLFAVALLRHLGTMVMLQKLPLQMESILKSVGSNTADLLDAEQDEFGYTHAEVGAELLQSWGMPDIFSEVTRHHHEFHLAPNHTTEAAIVNLADAVAHQAFPLMHDEGPAAKPDPAVFRYVNLSPDTLEDLCQTVHSRGGDASVLMDG